MMAASMLPCLTCPEPDPGATSVYRHSCFPLYVYCTHLYPCAYARACKRVQQQEEGKSVFIQDSLLRMTKYYGLC